MAAARVPRAASWVAKIPDSGTARTEYQDVSL